MLDDKADWESCAHRHNKPLAVSSQVPTLPSMKIGVWIFKKNIFFKLPK